MSRSEQYWREQSKDLEGLVDLRSRTTAAEISKLFDSALVRIEKDIRKIFGSYSRGYGLPPREAEKLLSQSQTREVREKLLKLLQEAPDPVIQQQIRAMLDAPAYEYRISKLEALRAEVYADAAAIGLGEVEYHRLRLSDVYRESYYRTVFGVSKSVGYNVPFQHLSNRKVEIAINRYWSPSEGVAEGNYSTRVWSNTAEFADEAREIITRGLMTGGHYSDMIDELTAAMGAVEAQKRITPDGQSRTTLSGSGSRYKAARLVRTECNYIAGQARMAAYKDAGIKKYMFHCLLELKTCQKCGELDGKIFPVSEQKVGVNMHPMHPHCRCMEGPALSEKELQVFRRTAETGPERGELIPQSMRYPEWRRKYVDNSPEMLAAEKALKRRKNTEKDTAQKPTTPKDPREVKPVKVQPVPFIPKNDKKTIDSAIESHF